MTPGMSSHILTNLNPRQQEAVKFSGGPLLILAGAGSGKTRVLTHRAAWIIKEKNVAPENLLLITFTNKAANEMKERIISLLDNNPIKLVNQKPSNLPLACTFHSFCARVLRVDGKHIGLSPAFVIYDENDQQDLVKQVLKKLNFYTNVIKPRAALATISAAKSEFITHQEYQDTAYGEWQKRLGIIFEEYQKLLSENQAVDFDDLLNLTVTLFEKNPPVLEKYQKKYQYILVDEWQDTNKAQYKLTKLLAQKYRNLTAVGDAAQSVYSWRGADHRNLEYLMRDFPNINVINLEQNYRSTQIILDSAFHVISQNKTHPILKLWTQNGRGDKISLYQALNEIDEANFVINEINRLLVYSPNHLASLTGGSLTYSDFAILYRTNAQSRVLEEALLHASIPYILVGGTRFYERKEVKDVVAYLRILANPKDSVSKLRVEKIGKTRYKNLKESANEIRIHELSTLELLDKILEITKYLDLYDPEDPDDLARLENIKELRSVATEFPEIHEFLEQVALVESAQNEKKVGHNSITLMTAHAAKGLEFTVVFIVGLEEGLFPHQRSLENNENLEEERRLCYVGMTRAKQKLYLTFCQRRLLFGQRTNSVPSRFLANIPKDLYEGEVITPTSWIYQE